MTITKHKDGGEAFPTPTNDHLPGMSVWDHYAGQALVGLLTNGIGWMAGEECFTGIAEGSANIADAMVAERVRRMNRE